MVPWLVALALVFQIVLTSAFMAQAAVAATPEQGFLCLTDPTGAPLGDADDGIGKALAHCPLCLSRVDVAVLPPPPAMPVLVRIALRIRFESVPERAPLPAPARPSHQPRAPPLAA